MPWQRCNNNTARGAVGIECIKIGCQRHGGWKKTGETIVKQQRKRVLGGIEREYAYKPRWTLIVFCGAFFGLVAVSLGAKAHGNDRGLILNHVIKLSPSVATPFY